MNTEKPKLVSKEMDYKSLEATLWNPLCKTPPTHQERIAKLQKHLSNMKYFPSEQLHVGDTFSRAPINTGMKDMQSVGNKHKKINTLLNPKT